MRNRWDGWRAAWVLLALAALPATAEDWPRFRGPSGAGVADQQDLPIRWDVASGENVRWATPIPGMGHSSPVVAAGRLFVTTAVAPGDETGPSDLVLGDEGGISLASDAERLSWRLYCLDAASGRVLWQGEAYLGAPRAKRHVKASQANPTPVVVGETVVAIFGSQGLVAFDTDGSERWRADLGKLDPGLFGDPSSEWGFASSPILANDRVFVQVDRHADSFLAAFDARSGERLWRVARDERPVWSTPLLYEGPEREELIVNGGEYLRAYDPASGRELWRFHDEAEVKIPSPFAAGDAIIVAGGYRGRPLFALRPGGEGDISLEQDADSSPWVAWKSAPGGPYTSTPLAYRGLLYSVRDEGILQVHDLATGELIHRQRTGATHAASPVASDGHLFVATEEGEILVYGAEREPELLARNDMGEVTMATPAIAGGTLFIRTGGHVYAIGRPASGTR